MLFIHTYLKCWGILLRFNAVSPKLACRLSLPSSWDLANHDCLHNDVGDVDFLATKDPVCFHLG